MVNLQCGKYEVITEQKTFNLGIVEWPAMVPGLCNCFSFYYRRDGVVVRAFALQSIDTRFISFVESYHKALKIVFAASLLGAQHKRESVESKPSASLLVVSLDKTLNGMPSSLCGTDSGAKQSTRRGEPVELKTSKKGSQSERLLPK